MWVWRRMTSRGRAVLGLALVFLAAGVITSQRDLVWVGSFMVVVLSGALFLVSWPLKGLRHERHLAATSVPVDESVAVQVILHSNARGRRLLHFEEVVPRHMGVRPRFGLSDPTSKRGRNITYALHASRRGRHQIGPLLVRNLDPFGLATHDMAFSSVTPLSVTPHVYELSSAGSGTAGDHVTDRSSSSGLVGADDVLVRDYRPGDEVRRVHWRSTAKIGKLMVRREEQSWSPTTRIVIDNRANAHAGLGMASSFEWAVSAAASIGIAMLGASSRVSLADAEGIRRIPEPRMSASRLLDELTDIQLVEADSLETAVSEASSTGVFALLGLLHDADIAALSTINT